MVVRLPCLPKVPGRKCGRLRGVRLSQSCFGRSESRKLLPLGADGPGLK